MIRARVKERSHYHLDHQGRHLPHHCCKEKAPLNIEVMHLFDVITSLFMIAM
ncbi:hypothetical protein IAD21_00181 [Abditibacteriota bacterium]|nr:hypothetical protein IAD21_00181 [Abditibacteriota bacterium]